MLGENNLHMNISMTKKQIVGFSMKNEERSYHLLTINKAPVERCGTMFWYLSDHITQDLSQSLHINILEKKLIFRRIYNPRCSGNFN